MIFVEEPVTWERIQVPPAIVRVCENFTRLDPRNPDLNEFDELRLLDCYWFHMGFYE